MKSKKLKGFTLIECIVAMAILGVASLLMVQVYGTIAKMTQDNTRMNNSMEKQMEYVENELQAANPGDIVTVTNIPSYTATGKKNVQPNAKIKFTPDPSAKNGFEKVKIDADVDLYIIGIDDSGATDGYIQSGKKIYDDNTIRYKFILPRTDDDPKE